MNKLAIIIPLYKVFYIEETLDSLLSQTNVDYSLYIGNDNSPYSLSKIIGKYKKIFESKSITFTYKRFNNNLGASDLVAHWYRCLDMVQDEEWVWMLPDDDIPSENVVKEFYKGLEFQKKYCVKVFKLPLSIIDQEGNFIKAMQYEDPLVETNLDFYHRVVRGKAGATLGDNIFHKNSLLQSGGFINFPKAWGSDHATILMVSSGGCIYSLPKARLYFRMSGKNISSNVSDGLIKLGARIEFVKWLKNHESIFPKKPNTDFYNFFFWKAEYYILNEWKYESKLFIKLYELRKICMGSYNILPIITIFLKKIII